MTAGVVLGGAGADLPFSGPGIRLHGADRLACRQVHGANAGNGIQRDGNHLGSPQASRRHECEVGEQRAGSRARRVDGVQHRDPPTAGCKVPSNEMTNQERQRAAHQHGDRGQEYDGDRAARDVRAGRQRVPAGRFEGVGRDRR
jgi:hypothetical protein